MELLKEIKEKDVVSEEISKSEMEHHDHRVIREASRAVVFDKENKIAFLNVSRDDYHKLPGGGIKEGEEVIEALKRECLEETGCDISITGEVGMIIEYRDAWEQLQKSYCYLAKVEGEKGEPKFTEKEKNKGFELMWVSIDEAIKLLENDKPANYIGKFIRARDLEFLKRAKNLTSKQF